MKPFDDKFADNVREVFDSYQEPFDKKAWETMQNEISKNKKKRIFWPLPLEAWAAAAAILTFVSGVLWFYALTPQMGIQDTADIHKERVTKPEVTQSPEEFTPVSTPQEPEIQLSKAIPPPLSYENAPVEQPEPQLQSLDLHALKISADTPGLASATRDTSDIGEINGVDTSSSMEVQLEKSYIITEPYLDFINGYSHDPIVKKGSSLQITAGPMMAYTHNQLADGFGYSAGVLNEWQLTDGFSISTGGVFTYNQFSFDPRGNSSLDYYALSPESLSNNMRSEYNYNSNFNNEYQLMAIDIPVNTKFTINNGAQYHFYFSAGFSSLLYLQEQFIEQGFAYTQTTEFDAAKGVYRSLSYSTQVTESEKINAFQRFDFARLLNLSVGYVINYDNADLIVEPFIKYPLGNLTSRNIQMGMGGISLKYSFKPW